MNIMWCEGCEYNYLTPFLLACGICGKKLCSMCYAMHGTTHLRSWFPVEFGNYPNCDHYMGFVCGGYPECSCPCHGHSILSLTSQTSHDGLT